MSDESGIPMHLLGSPFPSPRTVRPGRICRDWRVRTSKALLSPEALVSVLAAIENDVNEVLRVRFGISHRLSKVAISIYRIDDLHLIVSIETEDALDDVELFSQFAVIDALDEKYVLGDLQGIPADRWLEIRRARSARIRNGEAEPEPETIFRLGSKLLASGSLDLPLVALVADTIAADARFNHWIAKVGKQTLGRDAMLRALDEYTDIVMSCCSEIERFSTVHDSSVLEAKLEETLQALQRLSGGS